MSELQQNGQSDSALARAAEILSAWREGRPYSEVAAMFDLPIETVSSFLRALVSQQEREDQRARLIAKTQQRFSDDDLVEMLKTCALEIGRTPGAKRFDLWSRHYWSQLLLMRFGSWAQACERAGLVSNDRPTSPLVGARRYSDEDMRRAYQRIEGLLDGRTVTVEAWKKYALPSEPQEGICRRRYGTWREFKAAMKSELESEATAS